MAFVCQSNLKDDQLSWLFQHVVQHRLFVKEPHSAQTSTNAMKRKAPRRTECADIEQRRDGATIGLVALHADLKSTSSMVGILEALVQQLEQPTIDRTQLNQALVLITTLVHVYGAASLIVAGGPEVGATRASRVDVKRAVSVWRRLVALETSSPHEVPLDMFRITEAMHVRYERQAQEQHPLRGTAAQRRVSGKFPGSRLAEFAQSLVNQNSRLAPCAQDRGFRSSSFLATECMRGLFALHSADASFDIVQHASALPPVDLDAGGTRTRMEFKEYVQSAFREHEQARTPQHAPGVDISLWASVLHQCADLEAKIKEEQCRMAESCPLNQNARRKGGRDHTSSTAHAREGVKRRRTERVLGSKHLEGVTYDHWMDDESSCDETADHAMADERRTSRGDTVPRASRSTPVTQPPGAALRFTNVPVFRSALTGDQDSLL
jgi:hypothetical protein